MEEKGNDKPVLLRAIEMILADPVDVKQEATTLMDQFRKRYQGERSEDEISDMVAEKIISNYSYYAAFVGGASALAGVVPGLGTVISTFGGTLADAALTMKIQMEMTMALAVVYGHDIELEEYRRVCFIIAGLGAINQTAQESSRGLGSKAFLRMTQKYLQGATLKTVKEIFKRVGVNFERKALEKAIPYGVGVIIGFSTNKGLTWYVGTKARDFFKVY